MPKNDQIISNTDRHAEIRCGTCGNVSTVEVDEDGAALPATKCSQAGCTEEMCDHEDGLVLCTICELPVCEKHSKRVAVPIFDFAIEMEWWCDNCCLSQQIYALCVCPELENLSDGPEDSADPRPACPVHGTVLYGGETITHQELQRQANDMFEASVQGSDEEVPGCPF
jgi:hypothetical protein